MKHKSYLVPLLILLFTVITVYGSNLLFHNLSESVVAGLLVCILSTLSELRLAIHASEQTSAAHIEKAHEHLTVLFKVHDSYYTNEWLVKQLNTIVELKTIAEKQAHDLTRFERIINTALQQARSEVGTPFRIETKGDELDRSLRLKETVSGAKHYVYAVTYDANDYLNRFWGENFGPEYVKANLATVKRGVNVQRIFVVGKAVVEGSEAEKHRKLIAILRMLKRNAGNGMELYVLAIEDLPAELQDSDTSFLLSDDYVGSESFGRSRGTQIQGYVEYGNQSGVVDPLKQRFKDLKRYAKRH